MEEFCGSEFWDPSLTWNTTTPRFTYCFEKTLLVWLPCGYLWLFAALEIHYLIRSKNRMIPWTFLNVSKLMASSCLLVTQVLDFSYQIDADKKRPMDVVPNDFLSPVLVFVSILLQTIFVMMEKKRGIQSSGYLAIFWVLMVVCGIPHYWTSFVDYADGNLPLFPFVVYNVYFPVTVVMLLLNCFADARPKYISFARGSKACPELDASFLSRLTFFWLERLVWRGYRRPLQQEALWDLSEENTSKKVVRAWSRNWQRSLDRTQRKAELKNSSGATRDPTHKKTVSVLPTMVRTFGAEFFTGTLMKIMYDALQFVSPQVLRLLIAFTEDKNVETWKGFMYAGVMFAATQVQSFLMGQYSIKVFLVGQRVRTGIISAVYRKALRISNSARKESTVGEIVNLMSVDAQRFMDLSSYLNILLSSPVTIGFSIYFLWDLLGVSAVAGLLMLLLLIPINGLIANQVKKLQIIQMKSKDERVKMMNEILNGMKVLKLYAWEPTFENQVLEVRKKEIDVIRKTAYYNAGMTFFFTISPFLVTYAMFITYVLINQEHQLTADKIFVSISLMNILRMPLYMIPFLIVSLVQSSVSLTRLNKFLNADELDPNAVSHHSDEDDDVTIKQGTFAWSNDATDPEVLKDININIKKGSLVAVVGAVGAGKTSLCSALLGDMEKRTGTVNVKGRIAYAPQQAWIQNSVLKDNILFGKDYERSRYEKALDACALTEDLKILAAGDMTEIGEKGINLSGGQKQRVSLARAVYSDCDILLLDDPLSAVDSHVGKHIFTHVIGPQGILTNKTRIFVTHSVQYLPEVDHIVVVKDGRISEQGSYKELLDRKGEFQDFLIQYLAEEEEEDVVAELSEIKSQLEQKIGREKFERQISKRRESVSSDRGSVHSGDGTVQGRRLRKDSEATGMPLSPAKTGDPAVGEKIIQEEMTQTGKVNWRVYLYYMKAVGTVAMVFTLVAFITGQCFTVGSNLWLTKWSNDNSTEDSVRNKYLGVYGGLGLGQAVCALTAGLLTAKGTVSASSELHKNMLQNILRNPMSFFDVTPTGRIVNRFSKDIDTIDTLLPMNFKNWLQFFIMVVATFLVIVAATPWFAVVLVPCIIVYYAVQVVYVTTSRQLKRIESVARSPIYSHFGETIQGASTVRAYGKEDQFIEDSEKKVDLNQTSYFPGLVANRWLSIRLEFIGNVLTFSAAIFAVLARESISSGIVGLSISYAQSVTMILYFLVRMASDLETNIVSVERLKEYCETTQEAPWEKPEEKPQRDWPEEGVVRFNKYSTRYREGLDLVVKDIDCTVQAGEKVGIVGRTGAGKSSLTLSLFRIIEAAAGHIIIDGTDIATIGLHDLRSRLTIIPQDPVLFSGSLRLNLDPFGRYTDEQLWAALEQAHLKVFVKCLDSGLEHEISEGGENFSVGQRQLVCLARALLRRTRILVLDEATAAIDLETDDLIQTTIREQFATSTVITIAHRLNTIMDSDRILVLDKGVVKEFATPAALLADTSSVFYGLAKDAGLV